MVGEGGEPGLDRHRELRQEDVGVGRPCGRGVFEDVQAGPAAAGVDVQSIAAASVELRHRWGHREGNCGLGTWCWKKGNKEGDDVAADCACGSMAWVYMV